MESILPDLPPLPRRRITLPLSTLAEVARDVCDGYDPPRRGHAYAKAHPLWRELPPHLHALMNATVPFCRGRAGELTLTRCTSLGGMVGRTARTVRRQLALIAGHGLIVTGQTRGGGGWGAPTRAAGAGAGGRGGRCPGPGGGPRSRSGCPWRRGPAGPRPRRPSSPGRRRA